MTGVAADKAGAGKQQYKDDQADETMSGKDINSQKPLLGLPRVR